MKRLLAFCLAAAAATAGVVATPAIGQQSSAPRGQVVDGVVATVNDQIISQSDVRNRMRMILLSFPGQPDEEVLREVQQLAIEGLIDEKVQLQEFSKLVKDEKISDAEIDEQIARLAQQNRMTPEQFISGLAQAGVSISALREQQEAEIAWTALIRGRYGKQVRVSELRVNDMLQRLKANLDKPQYRLAEIFLFAPDQESRNNAKARADTLIAEINRGAEFDQVARQFSAAPSASQGGDLSWMSPGDMRPEIWTAVQNATSNPPTLLPPIESDGGVYIIALLGKREPVGPGSVILDLAQVIARGDGAEEKLAQVKAKATTCRDIPAAIAGVEGVTAEPMNDIPLEQVADVYRAALESTEAGKSTDVIDLSENGGKMMFYVCERASGTPGLPPRDEIYDRLFNQELAMVANRYLRDLKREATIDRR